MAITGGGGKSSNWYDEALLNRSRRNYPFEIALNIGLNSASSSVIVNAPAASLFSGALTAPPQSKGREMGEKNGPSIDIWTGEDGLNYWGRKMTASVFLSIGTSNLSWSSGADAHIYEGLYLYAPGIPPWNQSPTSPYAMLMYHRLENTNGRTETWELWTAEGNGNSALISTLTGVLGPSSPVSPGGAATQRLGLLYEPGVAVSAYVDGVLGAKHTTNLPITTTIPAAQVLAGIGVYVDTGQSTDSARGDFHNLILETFR